MIQAYNPSTWETEVIILLCIPGQSRPKRMQPYKVRDSGGRVGIGFLGVSKDQDGMLRHREKSMVALLF